MNEDAERGRRMIMSAIAQACNECPKRSSCFVKPRCINTILLRLREISDRAKKHG